MPADTSIYRNKLTPEQKESLISDYLGGMTCKEVGQRYGVKACSAWELLKRRGLTRAPKVERKYTLDESAFDSITPESAYWAGMLMADGCVNIRGEDGRTYLILSQHESDRGQVEKFLAFLGSNQPPTHDRKRRMVAVHVCSTRLTNAVQRFGITPRKSLTAEASPDLIDNRDFWRGCIDGDGTVSLTGTGYPFVSLCGGSEKLIRQYRAWAKKVVPDFKANIGFSRNTYSLVVFGKQAIPFIHLLYDGCGVALDRKLATANHILHRADSDPIWCRRSWRTADREFRELVRQLPTSPKKRH